MANMNPQLGLYCSSHGKLNCPICMGRMVDTVIVQSPGEEILPPEISLQRAPDLSQVQPDAAAVLPQGAFSVKSAVRKNIKRGG